MATLGMLPMYPFYTKGEHGTWHHRVNGAIIHAVNQLYDQNVIPANMTPETTLLLCIEQMCVSTQPYLHEPISHFIFVAPCPDRVSSMQSFKKLFNEVLKVSNKESNLQ